MEKVPLESSDFRRWLQQELVRRCRENPKYSLRAFARFLGAEPSELSKILKGTRKISLQKFLAFSVKLELNPEQKQRFRKSLSEEYFGSSEHNSADADYSQLTLDAFQVIADWYHYALLELTTVQEFQPRPQWIAKALNISVNEVNAAVERLLRLGFLEISEEGRWIDRSGAITTVGNEFTAAAFKKLQRAVLEKALAALIETPFEKRDQSSMTMAIDSRLLPEAKLRILKFRRSLCDFLQSGKNRDQVYHLGVSLYPVTHLDQEKK